MSEYNLDDYIENATDEFLDNVETLAIDALEDHINDFIKDMEAFYTTDRFGNPCLVWDESEEDILPLPLVSELLERYSGYEPHEDIHECADSNVPHYTSTILQLAVDNWELATNEPEIGPAYDGKATPLNIIAANIYERLERECWDKWNNINDWLEIDLDGDTFALGCNLINRLLSFHDFKLDY